MEVSYVGASNQYHIDITRLLSSILAATISANASRYCPGNN